MKISGVLSPVVTPRRLWDQFRGELALRGVFAKFPMIPALKAAIAHYGGDAGWGTVRPPLVVLTPEQTKALVTELDQKSFTMPGLAAP